MPKTNKELAVELYCAILQSSATAISNIPPNGVPRQPSTDAMVATIKDLAEKLAQIEDR